MQKKELRITVALAAVLLVTAATALAAALLVTAATAPAGDYLVIDLSGGTGARRYPVIKLQTVPPGGWTDEHKTTKLVLRKIPKGTFIKGSPEGELGRSGDYEVQHQVTLSQDFYIGVFEVTQRQYALVTGAYPSHYKGDALPVAGVSYNTIRGSTADGINWPDTGNRVREDCFLGRIRARTGLAFDLPTEAQWEYACRAGTTTALNSGKNLATPHECPNMKNLGRYLHNRSDGKGSNTLRYTKVGMYLPNNWGLYDMHGNVSEWCLDWWDYSSYGTAALTDPKGPVAGSGGSRILQGGSLDSEASGCRSAFRYPDSPGSNYGGSGFRVCVPSSPIPWWLRLSRLRAFPK